MKRIYLTVLYIFVSIVVLWSQNLAGTIIYVNPGHGGYDADDRNITIYPYTQGDHNGFWESQSNLDKGKMLKSMLENAGATVYISRTTNTTADDLPLSQVVQMANSAGSDFMLSIHSNAGNGVANHVLQLYAGITPGDTQTYPSPTPCSDESRAICQIIAADQYSNQANSWSAGYSVVGDKTFGRTAMGWSDGYGVLRGLTVPGTISEGSMHDYIPETYRLMNMEYKWLEAWHFYKSFCTYFNAGTIPTGNIVGTIHDSRNLNMASYYKFPGKDRLLPLHGAKVTVSPGGYTYTTDSLYNGVYVIKNLAPGMYEVTTEMEGYVPQTVNMQVKANETTYNNLMLNLIRNTPPEVISYSPNSPLTTPVECSTPIVFEFNWDVDTESAIRAFSITPDLAGVITFEDSQHRMIFTPDKPYEISTTYTVKLDTQLKHPAEMHMVSDFSFQFYTKDRNRLEMFANYPKDGDKGVYYLSPNFEFRFDQRLNSSNTGIRDAIKVYKDNVELSKVSRSIKTNDIASPYGSQAFKLAENLVPGQEYKIVLGRNVIDITGIDIVDTIEYTFKAVDVKVTDKTIAEAFETAGLFAYNTGQSTATTSATFARNTTDKLFGTSSGKFTYTFTNALGGSVLYSIATPSLIVNSTKVLGAHLYGDLSGNEVHMEFTAVGDVQYVKLTDLDFSGWEFSETALTSLIPGKDYTFTGIKVVQVDKPLTTSGNFAVDNLLLYDDLITTLSKKTISDMKIYQLAGKLQVVSELEKVMSLELYSITGTLLDRSPGSSVDIGFAPAGTYVLKVILENRKISKSVILVK